MSRRRIERHEVDDLERQLDRNIGGKRGADENAQVVRDLDMATAPKREGVRLRDLSQRKRLLRTDGTALTGITKVGEKLADVPASTPIHDPFAVGPLELFLPSSSVVSATFFFVHWTS